MKKLITICLFITSVFTVNGQNLNFDETVTYIKTKLEDKGSYSKELCYVGSSINTVSLREISISPDGQIKCLWAKTGGKSIYPPVTFNLKKVLKIENKNEKICFYMTANSYYLLAVETEIDSERLTKAFNHLKLLLPKEKDPFDK